MFFTRIYHICILTLGPPGGLGNQESVQQLSCGWQQQQTSWAEMDKEKGRLKFSFTAPPDGSLHQSTVICVYSRCEMSCHWNTSISNTTYSPPSSRQRQDHAGGFETEMEHRVFYYENESDVLLFIRCVTSSLLCAEYGWINVLCFGIQQK